MRITERLTKGDLAESNRASTALARSWENEKTKGVNSSTVGKAKNEWCTCTKVPRLGQQG